MHPFSHPSDLDQLIAELDGPDDPEHPEIAVSDDSGWTLSAFPSGLVIWEDVEGGDAPRHRTFVSRHELLDLLLALTRGDVATIDWGAWVHGYGR